jgi:hypothetical protein
MLRTTGPADKNTVVGRARNGGAADHRWRPKIFRKAGNFIATKSISSCNERSPSMAEIVFYCPNVDLTVQHLLDENLQKSDEEIYESILCLACTRLHFINKKTRKLLGQAD